MNSPAPPQIPAPVAGATQAKDNLAGAVVHRVVVAMGRQDHFRISVAQGIAAVAGAEAEAAHPVGLRGDLGAWLQRMPR